MYLALPTIAQMSSYTVMQFIDRKFIASLGTQAAAAATNAGMISFSLIAFGFGVAAVVNSLVSQRYGEERFDLCGRYLWQGIWFSGVYGLLMLLLLPFGEAIFRLLGHAPDLVAMEASLMRVYLSWTLVKLVGMCCGQFLLATNRPNANLVAAVVAVGANAVAAYALIFGHLGLPKLGVVGAAWGQNIGVTIETLILIAFCLSARSRNAFASLDHRFRSGEFQTLLRIGFGSGLQILGDVITWTLFAAWVVGAFGEKGMAANSFAFGYMITSFMPTHGLAVAVTALVGRYIGMRRPDLAMKRGHLGFVVGAVWMLACGVIFIVFREALIGFFTSDPVVLRMGTTVMVFCGIYQIFDAMYVIYSGALRGAGDTFIPAVISNILCWSLVVGAAGAMARLAPQYGIAGPWTVATIYGGLLGIFLIVRFGRGKWMKIHLDDSNTTAQSDTFSRLESPLAPAISQRGEGRNL
jgi:MATE family multidrug resistance protein